MNIQELLLIIGENLTNQEVLDVLCDGETLAKLGITDEEIVTDAYNFIKERIL